LLAQYVLRKPPQPAARQTDSDRQWGELDAAAHIALQRISESVQVLFHSDARLEDEWLSQQHEQAGRSRRASHHAQAEQDAALAIAQLQKRWWAIVNPFDVQP
jgi:hypothetical protein